MGKECCPPSKSGNTFSGIKSGNFSRSSSECDPFKECPPCAELPVQPYTATHELTFCKCGNHVVPFFAVSRATYNGFLEASCILNKEVADTGLNRTPLLFNSGVVKAPSINATTLLPTVLADGYEFGAVTVADPAVYVALGTPVGTNDIAINAILDVCIPKTAESGIIVDLTDVTTFADSIYTSWNPVTGGTTDIPGVLQPTVGISGVSHPGTNSADVEPALGSSHPTDIGLSGAALSACHLLNKPRVNIYNRSNCPAYLRVNNCDRSFEHVSNQMGVRPNTKVTVEYNPQHKVWCLLDTNSRA